MKKSVLTAALCLCLFPIVAKAKEPLPRLQVNGNHLLTIDGKDMPLRGVSLCSLEWHNPIAQIEELISSDDKWNANVIRLPIQVKEWDKIGADKYISGYLDPAVRQCERKNVYCIIDWHEIAPWKEEATQKKLEDFWKRVAPRYAANPNILYEIFNEPTKPEEKTEKNWIEWRDTMQKWVEMIRKDAPRTVLLVGSPHWSQMPSYALDNPIDDGNVAYVMHLYPNYSQADWDKLFGNASKTLPIFITEWGWSSTEKSAGNVIHGTKEKYANPLKAYLNERPQISWTAWSYDPLCGPAMQGDDKEMADFVKQWLSEDPQPIKEEEKPTPGDNAF